MLRGYPNSRPPTGASDEGADVAMSYLNEESDVVRPALRRPGRAAVYG